MDYTYSYGAYILIFGKNEGERAFFSCALWELPETSCSGMI
ncbi:hypothetical protein LHGZ1_1953 [Laribacter hongkongensis]|uniref:Uncharacterized protein n=1 Tax=Laribacter hongkongensis TaxID=168471 RepID=A0A248LK03_9NEIS|nr:hypothetical protein LHGZ1_1953 [Laribacter hongkongensis]